MTESERTADPRAEPDIATLRCSWVDFHTVFRRGRGQPMDALYRGQADAGWALVSPLRRGQFEQWMAAPAALAEGAGRWGWPNEGQLRYFRALSTGLPGVDIKCLDDKELAALARHNGIDVQSA